MIKSCERILWSTLLTKHVYGTRCPHQTYAERIIRGKRFQKVKVGRYTTGRTFREIDDTEVLKGTEFEESF